MNDDLYKAAKSFESIANVNYLFTLGNSNRRIIVTTVSCNKSEFSHVVGLDHLKDIAEFSTHNTKIKERNFRDILSGKIKYSEIEKTSSYLHSPIPLTLNESTNKEYTIAERIKALSNVEEILDNAFKGEICKWNKNKSQVRINSNLTKRSTISADYLLSVPSSNNSHEKIYFFMYQVNKECKLDEPIILKIHSAFPDCLDLTQGQNRPYTILQEKKVNIKTKHEEILFTHSAYLKESVSSNSIDEKPKIYQFSSQSKPDYPVKKYALKTGTISYTAPMPKDPFTVIDEAVKTITTKISQAFEQLISKPQPDKHKPPVSVKKTCSVKSKTAVQPKKQPSKSAEKSVKPSVVEKLNEAKSQSASQKSNIHKKKDEITL